MTDKVVDISTRFSEPPPVDIQPKDYSACRHEHTVIDEVLRTVSCGDCREERLDPIEVLLSLSRQWDRWRREAEGLNRLNREYQNNRRDQWERKRDRHLNAHPEHRAFLTPGRSSWSSEDFDRCRPCHRLEVEYDRRWYPSPAPEGAS